MKLVRRILTLISCVGLLHAGAAWSADAPKDLVLKGDAKCTACHDEADSPKVLSIGKTRHGTNADGRIPTCTSCHGQSDLHADYKGSDKPPKPERTFGAKTLTPTSERNDACLSCHQKDAKRHLWAGSIHESRDVACTNCHQMHTAHDKVGHKATQPEVCFTCHKQQRIDVNKPSHHPIMEGKVACSACQQLLVSTGGTADMQVGSACLLCCAAVRMI